MKARDIVQIQMGSNGAEQGKFSVSARTGSARRQITTILGLVHGESDVIRLEDLPEKIRAPLPGGNQSRAALLLKVPRHLLLYRMERFALPRKPPETL